MKTSNNSGQNIYKKIQNYIFRFGDLLGQGNFSKVYSGQNELTCQIVAIKIVELESLKSRKLQELLFSQIEVLKKLNHPNILRCHEVFTSNRNCYIITQLCNEGDLDSRLRRQHHFQEAKALPIIKDIFQGLQYLAQKNVIHRDIKIANIFMHNGSAKIADFGFAKFTKQKFQDINIGSPIYMSPQGFINNIYGPKTDVWAFGVLLFQLLHGQTPFSYCRTETQLKNMLSIPLQRKRLKHQLSSDIKDVILRCLQIDDNKRPSVSQLAQMPFFLKLFGKHLNLVSYSNYSSSLVPPLNNQTYGSTQDLRIRSPSLNPPHSYTKLDNNDNRGISNQKMFKHSANNQSYNTLKITEPKYQNYTRQPSNFNKLQILSGIVTFKQCVNVLHLGRLVFKFILTLKVSDYSNDNEISKLTRWLMQLLNQVNQKINRGQVKYEGQNAHLRQQKLKQVRNQYQKKYKSELSNYIKSNTYGQLTFSLIYIKNFCYNLFQKYDSMINTSCQDKSLIMLGHCLILINQSLSILIKAYQNKNFSIFLAYRQLQTFLSIPKQKIDIKSYFKYRQKVVDLY